MPPAPGGYGAPAPAAFKGTSAGGAGNTIKAIGGGILAVVVAIGYGGLKFFGKKALGVSDGNESLSSLGIDQKKADPDKMIMAAQAYAKKWKSDAAFWSITIQNLGPDGTTDLSASNVVVEYFSPSKVSSILKTDRDDSIKKFNFINESMQYKDIWGVTKQYNPPPKGPPVPACTAKKLAETLVKSGALKPGQTIQASIDPAFSETSWIVQTPGKPSHFDTATCAPRKD
jgi:hypothetical protein